MIPRRFGLLVARLVLLVDDDGAEIRERGEDRGSGADGNALLSTPKRKPRIVPLAIAQRGVQHRDRVPEYLPEPIDRLWRERNLRHEHDGGLASLADDTLQQLDVDERFAAASDAVQEKHFAWRARR